MIQGRHQEMHRHESSAHDYHQLACACALDKTRLSEAARYSRLAVQAEPDNALYYAFLGRDLAQVGQAHVGVDMLRRAVQMAPENPDVRASYLWYLSYLPEQTPERTYLAYRQWADDFTPAQRARSEHERVLEPERRLRIAYISPDFRRHSVAYYFEPILDGHDRHAVEIFGYANVAQEDETSRRLQAKFDVYRPIWGLSPEALADQIEQDQIDILIALAGHCTNNSLYAMAYKPAPIQVDLGGITTTGMQQIDYRITDSIVDPPDGKGCFSERLAYLPGGWSVFRPPQESPLVGPLPAYANGYITFGTFNNNAKIDEHTIALWSRILSECPRSKLLFKCFAAGDQGIRRFYLDLFARHGIDQKRIQFCGERPYDCHLEFLASVDIALDSFPFNGAMTTLEGLWMGVPIVTLMGQTCVARQGYDILSRLGLDVFAARHPDEYVAKAISFARQWDELACIRAALRNLLLDSPLCRPGRMASELEFAYREMWQHWVEDRLSRSAQKEKKDLSHVGGEAR
jgi:protein O-GlcNAc transferase